MMQIKILNTDFTLDTQGYAVSVADSFADALTTPLGSVIGRPEYGTDINKLKHKVVNSSFLIDLKRYLKNACKFDPRLEFVSADVYKNELDVVGFTVNLKNNTIKGILDV